MSIRRHIENFAKELRPGSRVLDVGCGLRPYEHFFVKSQYLGIDVETSGRKPGDKLPDQFYDGVRIPFGNDEFDAIICTQVLEHCVDLNAIVSDFRRVLKADGRLFVTVPFIWGEHEPPYDFRRFTSFGVKKLLEDHGFEITDFHKLSAGISAIEVLVESEKTHFMKEHPRAGLIMKVLSRVERLLWGALIRLWRKMYRFDRIYLDNVVVASLVKS
jgi:SAM-dependent methyltransferase